MKLDAINFRDGNSWTSLKDLIYPVGSIYMNARETDNPGNTIGDTWAKIESKFLLGQSSTYAIGKTGGAATHTLTINEMPRHNHSIYHYITANNITGGENVRTNGTSKDTKWTWKDIISSTGGGNLTTICHLIKSLLFGREQLSLPFGGVVA